MPDWKEFRDILPSACLSVDSIPIYRYKSVPGTDFGLVGWDWAGNQGRIRSAGAAVGFGHAFERFFYMFAAA